MYEKTSYICLRGPSHAAGRRRHPMVIAPNPAQQPDPYPACPKCSGQYLREGAVCHCYQCCFEWDLRDPRDLVLARARRRPQPDRPGHVLWDGHLDEPHPTLS